MIAPDDKKQTSKRIRTNDHGKKSGQTLQLIGGDKPTVKRAKSKKQKQTITQKQKQDAAKADSKGSKQVNPGLSRFAIRNSQIFNGLTGEES